MQEYPLDLQAQQVVYNLCERGWGGFQYTIWAFGMYLLYSWNESKCNGKFGKVVYPPLQYN